MSKKNVNYKTEQRLITPAEAKDIFENKNKSNRRFSLRHGNWLKLQMLNNKWLPTGDPLKFSSEGNLLDGQHRMYATWQSNKPQWFLIITNVPQESFTAMDTGKTRSAADVLSTKGYANPTILSSAIRAILQLERGHFSDKERRVYTTNELISEFAANNIELLEIVTYMNRIRHRTRYLPTGNLTALYFAMRKKNARMAEEWFDLYGDPEKRLPQTHPLTLLKERLMRDYSNRGKLNLRAKMALFILAWNAWRKGQPLKSLVLDVDYKFPTIK